MNLAFKIKKVGVIFGYSNFFSYLCTEVKQLKQFDKIMITLNGQSVKLPCKVVSLGLDMQCHHCVTTSTILSVDAEEDKVIIKSEGIKIRLQIKDLEHFYVNTKENRKMLQDQCDKEYNDWIAALNKEADEIERLFGVKQSRFKGLVDGEHYMGDDRTRFD